MAKMSLKLASVKGKNVLKGSGLYFLSMHEKDEICLDHKKIRTDLEHRHNSAFHLCFEDPLYFLLWQCGLLSTLGNRTVVSEPHI